jgi:DUF1680 family protein
MYPIKLQDIRVTDTLFGHYINKVEEVMLSHQWKILNDTLDDTEPTHCIENFRIAAGLERGRRQGVVFQDTDLYKWMESASYVIASGRGEQYKAYLEEIIPILAKAQEADGYLNTYFQIEQPDRKWKNLVEGHELYTSGHMIEAAVAYTEATGKTDFLEIAKKNADLICRIFGTGANQIPGVPGHEEIEVALIKLYRLTRDEKYLKQASYFVHQRGTEPNYLQQEIDDRNQPEFFREFSNYSMIYAQAHKPPVEQSDVEGHAVRAMYLYSAMADLAVEEQDQEMEAACDRLWKSMTKRRMYITGGIGSSGFLECFTTDYDLPNATNYCETCASVGIMMFGQRMSTLKKDASYYDEVERALYNTLLAAMNLEGTRYFYVNPLEMVPDFCTKNTYMDHVKPVRQKWFNVACCPPNLARTLASLGQYIYAMDDEGICIHQFIASELNTKYREETVKVRMASRLLQDGSADIETEFEEALVLKIRIPYYAKNATFTVDGAGIKPTIQNHYAMVELSEGKHTIRIQLDVKPRYVSSNHQVRMNVGKKAVMNGPMVYCVEEADNGTNLAELYIHPNNEIHQGEALQGFPGDVPNLTYQGERLQQISHGTDELYGDFDESMEPVEITAVPYAFWNNRGSGEMRVWQNTRI